MSEPITEETCQKHLRKINDSLGENWETDEFISCTKTYCDSCALEIDNVPLYHELYRHFTMEKEMFGRENGVKAIAYSRGALEIGLGEGAELAVSGDIPLDERDPKTEGKMALLEKACEGLYDVHEHEPAVHVHIDNCPLDKFLKAAKKL